MKSNGVIPEQAIEPAMMDLQPLVTVARVACDRRVSSKKRALERLSSLLAAGTSCAPELVFDSLVARERLGSTGLGHGVALPHARLPQISEPLGALLRTTEGVDFDALDGQPVTLMFGLVVPEELTQTHLEILAQLAERFRDETFCAALRDSDSRETLYQVLCGSGLTISSA